MEEFVESSEPVFATFRRHEEVESPVGALGVHEGDEKIGCCICRFEIGNERCCLRVQEIDDAHDAPRVGVGEQAVRTSVIS